MEVKRVAAKDKNCNFCNRGKLSESGMALIFPYKEVIEIKGNGIIVTMCDDCVKELIERRAI